MPYQSDLPGKITLVAGASRGIGEATAHFFARNGAHVIVARRKLEDCETVAASIRARAGLAEAPRCHLGDMENIAGAMKLMMTHGGGSTSIQKSVATRWAGDAFSSERKALLPAIFDR